MLALPSAGSATTINVVASDLEDTIAACNLRPGVGGGVGGDCKSIAYLSNVVADPTSTYIVGAFNGTDPTTQTFQTAFDNWNAANGNQWTLALGGGLDIKLNVTINADAQADLGGINNFTVTLSDYNKAANGPELNQLGWSQGLYVNYRPPFTAGIEPPLVTLDTYGFSQGGNAVWNPIGGAFSVTPCQAIPGAAPGPNNTTPSTIAAANPAALDSLNVATVRPYCDPIYPFQYADSHFFDGPMGHWPDASFRAIALLSTVTFVTDAEGGILQRKLTVYEGLNWGFDLSVPEPATVVLMVLALVALVLQRRTAQRQPGTAR